MNSFFMPNIIGCKVGTDGKILKEKISNFKNSGRACIEEQEKFMNKFFFLDISNPSEPKPIFNLYEDDANALSELVWLE